MSIALSKIKCVLVRSVVCAEMINNVRSRAKSVRERIHVCIVSGIVTQINLVQAVKNVAQTSVDLSAWITASVEAMSSVMRVTVQPNQSVGQTRIARTAMRDMSAYQVDVH